jgi:translation initiation factor 1 (eIF-1/SUI1)
VIDESAAVLAFRNRAITLSVATTGSASLSATALGFARSSGSFITDGFVQGQEISATGFSAVNNAAKVITGVTAGFLTIKGGCAVQSSTAGRTILCGLPSHRAWENEKFDQSEAAGFPYIAEQFVPATSELKTIMGQGGTVEETGLYVLTLFGLSGAGQAGIRKYVNALKSLYAPGTTMTAGSHTIRVRGDTSTRAGQIIPLGGEWSTCQLTIPWRAFSINAIAA